MKSRLGILLITGLLAFALSLTVGALEDGAPPPNQIPIRSTFSSKKAGLKALYLVCERFHPQVQRWMTPLDVLAESPVGTLVACNPSLDLPEREKKSLNNWLDRGGQLILLVDEQWLTNHSEETPELPSRRIQVWEVADCLSNSGLKDNPEDCLIWVQRLIASEGPLYFDEYHHGIAHRRTWATLFLKFLNLPSGKMCLHLLLATCLMLFAYRLRIDRKRLEEEQTKELVDARTRLQALQSLIQHAKSPELAARIIKKYHVSKGK